MMTLDHIKQQYIGYLNRDGMAAGCLGDLSALAGIRDLRDVLLNSLRHMTYLLISWFQ